MRHRRLHIPFWSGRRSAAPVEPAFASAEASAGIASPESSDAEGSGSGGSVGGQPPEAGPPRPRRGLRMVWGIALAILCLDGGMVAAALLKSSSSHPATKVRTIYSLRLLPKGTSMVAAARHSSTAIYGSAGSHHPQAYLSNPNEDGAPLVFLVKNIKRGWYEVYLPSRPNGSVGWVHMSAVKPALDHFRLRVNLIKHRLTVWSRGKVIMREPVGVGQAASPTPPGQYYITELLKQPDPYGLYGPYAFGLSVHSDIALIRSEFPASDGRIGLHGTDDPSGLGTDVSHGCIRVSNTVITDLAHMLPAGTPVQIAG